jgi:hypothetical protein
MAGDVTQAAAGVGEKIGRQFSVVSVLPAAVLTIYVELLISSGAWLGRPNWGDGFEKITDLSVGRSLLLVALAFGIALVTHPLQFWMIQILEGYWGASSVGRSLAAKRTEHHWKKAFSLDGNKRHHGGLLDEKMERSPEELLSRSGVKHVQLIVNSAAFRKARNAYPRDLPRVMPTRLGNILRRFEDGAGAPYGLDAVAWTPHLALLAPDSHVGYLRDSRRQLDLAVRVCLLCLLAVLITFVFLVDEGLWLLITITPYTLAYIAYRGAVVAAAEYGSALVVITSLNRFELYKHLHMRLPPTAEKERDANKELTHVAQLGVMQMDYDHGDTEQQFRVKVGLDGPI